ncbi:hypothetical protein GA0070624_3220 [Micromonospora rhizosphaerae]|uniref:Uncharacterized protein n=1 Tax=Micromonospora rhizosphaerae TaxID=568872 RepID=A0A1C6S964_9ACTN|nr:hypothetical protein GA0070624_3220 [Micromonospora rhizosphaerae]
MPVVASPIRAGALSGRRHESAALSRTAQSDGGHHTAARDLSRVTGRPVTAGASGPASLLTATYRAANPNVILTSRRCRARVPPGALLSRLHPRGRGVLFAPLACGLGTQKTINHVQGFRLRVELPPQHLPGLTVAGAGDQLPACLADEPHVAAGQAPPAPVPPPPDHLFHAIIVRMFD